MGTQAKRLLIGGPICRREWIIDAWFSHVAQALAQVEKTPQVAFIFIGGENDPTFTKIHEITQEAEVAAYVDYVDEPRNEDTRAWNEPRYERMVFLRNRLLTRVREIAPDYFLSLDSDILLHPDALRNMFESIMNFDVVGGRCYMTPKHDDYVAPSNINFGSIVNTRSDSVGVIKVDVVMAIVLMKPRAYSFDYKLDFQGEDLGIARNWREAGVNVGYDGRISSKHIMVPGMLNHVDPRCGF